MAPETYGLILAVYPVVQYMALGTISITPTSSLTIISWRPLAGSVNLYSGRDWRPKKMLSMRAIPSKHSKSYLQQFSVHAFFHCALGCSGVPVSGDFNLQLRGFLDAVDDRSFGIGGLSLIRGLPCGLRDLKETIHLRRVQCLVDSNQYMPRSV